MGQRAHPTSIFRTESFLGARERRSIRGEMKRLLLPLRRKMKSARLYCWKATAEFYVGASVFQAKQYLRRHGPITVLIDNSTLGHGITHESAWIDTGISMWGDIPVPTGYSARIPVHPANSSDRVYTEVKYLVGLAELAKAGLINLVTSAELHAEVTRQPIGRFRGYRSGDLNLFDDLAIPSLDGYHLDIVAAKESQQRRIRSRTDEPYATLARLLPEKSNLDAWHLHTAHVHKVFCFLTMDFRLVNNVMSLTQKKEFPQLDAKLMLPSELGAAINLRPIETFTISYRNAIWAVHPELNLTGGRRQPSPRRSRPASEEGTQQQMQGNAIISYLPRVKRIRGAEITHASEAVNIQYDDENGRIQELAMNMGDALYLLSILKAMQLNLDIPFPDDPRDPNARPVRPSERSDEQSSTG